MWQSYAIATSVLIAAPVMAAPADLLPGTYTNEEQVYFDKEAGRKAPAWLAIRIHAEGDEMVIEEPDAFGATHSEPHRMKVVQEGKLTVFDYGSCKRLYRSEKGGLVSDGVRGTCRAPATMTSITPFAITLTFPDGSTTELRRARPVSCWVAIRKDKPKADGSEDWFFKSGVMLHDQGGRASVGGGDAGAQPVIIRMRNVTWDKGSTNAPVVSFYIHKPESPDHAESYSWAAPDSSRVGINLRWVQSGCSIDAKPSKLTAEKFRG
jgi:hypothetical protein